MVGTSTVNALPSSQPEVFFRQTVFRIARNWARVPNADWAKIRDPLFTQCPHALTFQTEACPEKIELGTNERLSIIGLGLYFLESKGCHAQEIVPYLLWIEKNLLAFEFTERQSGRFSKLLLCKKFCSLCHFSDIFVSRFAGGRSLCLHFQHFAL